MFKKIYYVYRIYNKIITKLYVDTSILYFTKILLAKKKSYQKYPQNYAQKTKLNIKTYSF